MTSSSSTSGSFIKDLLAVARPSVRAVTHGMLAAIGIMIVAHQAHTAVGITPESERPLALLFEIPSSVAHADLAIALTGLATLLIVFGVPQLARRVKTRDQIALQVLMLIVALARGLLFEREQVPRAALAALLVHAGARLAATATLRQAGELGRAWPALVWSTVMATLLSDLPTGVAVGLGLAVVLHIVRAVQR